PYTLTRSAYACSLLCSVADHTIAPNAEDETKSRAGNRPHQNANEKQIIRKSGWTNDGNSTPTELGPLAATFYKHRTPPEFRTEMKCPNPSAPLRGAHCTSTVSFLPTVCRTRGNACYCGRLFAASAATA